MENRFPIARVLNFLKRHSTFVLLDNVLCDKENYHSYIFINPVEVIACYKLRDLKPSLEKLQARLRQGLYISGFLSYEAGYAFEQALTGNPNYNFPLLWMGVFKKPFVFDHRKNRFINGHVPLFSQTTINSENYKLKNLHLNTTNKQYLADLKKIKQYIAAGDTYQVNHTLKYKFDFKGSAFSFYQTLRNNQAVSYAAFIKSGEFNILSFSPELFFRQNKRHIYVRPMKGTAKRGISYDDDNKIKSWLGHDIKNRAENLMIVDLLRNDLGRVSTIGSVKTLKLFTVEKYNTLFQLTSTIKSTLQKKLSVFELFRSTFPSGSVTGAPKIQTMKIIRGLEKEERKIYTGSIGFMSPQQKSVFNVAIRTILLINGTGEMGIGGGITYSSHNQAEFTECKLKARFLTQPPFKLIETIRWSKKEGFFLLGLHLRRLKRSARFFGFSYNQALIKKHLKKLVLTLKAKYSYKIRLLLSENGEINIESSPLPPHSNKSPAKVILSKYRTKSTNTFLYHKSTNRTFYDKQYQKYQKLGYDDVLFCNEKGQITEGAISNIFIKKTDIFYTPPIKCGLLPGVFRQYFMQKNRKKAKEKILRLEDLSTAQEIYLANSVRGFKKVKIYF